MRLLADENVSLLSILLLRDRGLDVVSVLETHPGLDDPDVIRLARRLGRALITFDSDIGERIFKDGDPPPPSVIYLRFIQSDAEETARVVLQLLALDGVRVGESYVTYRNGRVRHQPLPPSTAPE
ncbi:DUF5615 family PIN-like protein [Rubrivirga sp. S365]|uniref:DUF5615 family PIN-like protein n=1 Tax=Rubrivirga litoralis TaxID=3075598 RepID=A0ABU3BPC5_9BACT|nr:MULTISPECIES: DUF5615 family PIN-like protein [unclassified Rubrivirga]MDT0631132.1 DUF5615 family PIN-like protein [Rubrivirga sp. F394]MDT7855355.1 DUF5615 family PIN-like protein [Rubrivirga sp. S365]